MAAAAPTFDAAGDAAGHVRAVATLLNRHAASTGSGAKTLPPFSLEQLTFLDGFVGHYGAVPTYTAHKDAFDHQPDVVSSIMAQLNLADATTIPALLRLLMIFSRSEKNQQQVAKVNGVTTLLAVMRRQNVNLGIQEDACRALINLATNDKNRKLIAADGGIDIILDCLRNGGGSPTLLATACWTVRNVAVHDANKKLIQQRGGVELLLRVMDKYPTDSALHEQACWALANMSLKDDVREGMVKAGCARAITTSMRGFASDRKLQEAGCWALANLAQHAKSRETLRREHAIEALMAASKAFPDAEELVKHVSEAVSAISESTDTAADDDDDDDVVAGKQHAAGAQDEPDKTRGAPLPVIKKGFLTKQGIIVKNWKKRWFVLDSRKITYFKTQEETHPLGTVILTSCQGVLEDPNKKFGIMVVTTPRTYRLVAATRHEMAEWMLAIKNVSDGLVKERQRKSSIAIAGSGIRTSAVLSGSGVSASLPVASGMLGSPKSSAVAVAGMPTTATSPLAEAGESKPTFVALDFFAPEEKTPDNEVEAVLLNQIFTAIETQNRFERLRQSEHAHLVTAVVARRVVQTLCATRLPEANILSIRGAPTDTYDALRLEKIVADLLPSHVDAVLADLDGARAQVKHPRPWRHQVWAEQGQRKTMEDRHVAVTHLNELMALDPVVPPLSIFGVFDGHGGTRASEYVGMHLYVNLVRVLEDEAVEAKSLANVDVVAAIKTAFLRTNDNFFEYLNRKSLVDSCGSTAVVALAVNNVFYVCWAGDSEAILVRKDGTSSALSSPTHKPSNEAEIARIERLGGFVQEINGVRRLAGILAVTRSFGDARFRLFVSPEPDIVKHTCDGTEDVLVLACDGLWDVFKPEDVAQFVRQYRSEHGSLAGASQALTKAALGRQSSDNVSVVLVEF